MKIVAINGSHRGTRGYTHFLIKKLFKEARDEGATCVSILKNFKGFKKKALEKLKTE